MAHHLLVYRVHIDKLLAASRVSLLEPRHWLVVAHCREALIGDSPQIATLIKADFVVSGGLHHLRLIHDLTDFFFEERVRQNAVAVLTPVGCSHWLAAAAADGGSFLRRILLFSVASVPAGVLFKARCFAFIPVGK